MANYRRRGQYGFQVFVDAGPGGLERAIRAFKGISSEVSRECKRRRHALKRGDERRLKIRLAATARRKAKAKMRRNSR